MGLLSDRKRKIAENPTEPASRPAAGPNRLTVGIVVGLALVAVVALAAAAFLLVGGSGTDAPQTPTPASGGGLRPVPTDSGVGEDIRVSYETHAEAINGRDEQVFCGGVTDRFVAETLRRPGAFCSDEAGRLFDAVKQPPKGDTVATAQVGGRRAQIETRGGLSYDLVLENDIWKVNREQ